MGREENYRPPPGRSPGAPLRAALLLLAAGCSASAAHPPEVAVSPDRSAGELDLIVVGGGAPEAATLLVATDRQSALVDGGPLGAPLAVLLDLCRAWRACEPDHLIVTPAAARGAPGLLFLLAGRDRQPGTADDLVPSGARLQVEPEGPCPTLACQALRDLLGEDRAAREGDTLLLGPGHRLRLLLDPDPRLEILGEGGATLGAILWGPGPCRLPRAARGWSFADLSRCPAGGVALEAEGAAPGLVILGAGADRCAGLREDRERLAGGGARVLLVGEGEACSLAPGAAVGRHLILRIGSHGVLPLRLSADRGIRPLPPTAP